MKNKYKVLFTFAVTLFSSIVWAQDGLFDVQGTSTTYGEYSGKAWVHGEEVQRMIRFKDYRYQGFSLETVWVGTASADQFTFSLPLSNVLTSYGSFAPTKEELGSPVVITLPQTITQQKTAFDVRYEGHHEESWQRIGDAGAPLWTNQRKVENGTGGDGTILLKIARWLVIDKVVDYYRNFPEVKAQSNTPEFKNKRQYFTIDKTDADFLRTNPSVLRIGNKAINPLSLAEAHMRRNAYAPMLKQKANFLGNETATLNLNAVGILELAIVDENGNKVGRAPEYDSALWTSVFGLSQILRYQATGDQEALANFRRVLNGILMLTEVTGDPKQFARSIAISPESENLGEGWVQGKGPYANLKWRQGGNNDMAKAFFITFAAAHKVIPYNDPLAGRIMRAVHALENFEPIYSRAGNKGFAHGLRAIWDKDESELPMFTNAMTNLVSVLGDSTELDLGFYVGGVSDWSGINLTMLSNISQILISEQILTIWPTRGKGYATYQALKAGQARLYEMQKLYKPAHRDFLTIFTYAFSPNARQDKNFLAEAKEALWTLREAPAPRNVGDGAVDLLKSPAWKVSAWPRTPWKVVAGLNKFKDNATYINLVQGVYAFPLFEMSAWSTTFYWKDCPFYFSYIGNKSLKSFSSDYLVMYWAARASGLISDQE